jgi:hypothetical protein
MDSDIQINYRWIYANKLTYKGKVYINYTVRIKDKYKYTSTDLQNSINYVLHYAKKNRIKKSNIFKTGKHVRI